MRLSSTILGASVVRDLQTRSQLPLLVIGSEAFTRSDLASVGCYSFIAATNLSRALTGFPIRNTRELFETIAPASLALPGVGAIAFSVIGAAFEIKEIGGDQPLESWATKHHPDDERREFVTFDTYKARAIAREAAPSSRRRDRSPRAGRASAPRSRVNRNPSRRWSTGSYEQHQ